MQLARILVSSLPMLAGLAAGLTAPRGLPDGNYLGFITPDGDEIHENLDTGVNVTIPLAERRAVDAAPGSPSALARRAELPGGGAGGVGKPVVYCGCLSRMNPNTCDDAVNGLKWQLDRLGDQRLEPRTCWYAIRNTVVAFVCNPITYISVTMSNAGYTSALRRITDDCGLYVPGTLATDSWYPVQMGYMNYHDGLDFFGTATSSNKHKC